MIKLTLILICLLTTSRAATISSVSVSTSNRAIRVQANYYFAIKIVNTIPSGGQIKATFPSVFTQLPTGGIQCSITAVTAASSVQCAFSGQNLIITGCFPTTDTTITFDVYGITNPSTSVTSDSFAIYTYGSSSNSLDQVTSGPTITFTSISLLNAQLVTGSQVSGELSSWTIFLQTNYEVPSGGQIQVKFPYWNQNIATSNFKPFCTGTLTCIGINNFDSSPSCYCSNNILYISGASSTSGLIQIQVNSILNPPNTDTMTGFSISTAQGGGIIETMPSISVSVTEPNELTISDIYVDNSQVNAITNYQISLECSSPIPKNANLYIFFPRLEFTLGSSVDTTISSFSGLTISPTYSISDNEITITGSFNSYLDPLYPIGFQVSNIKNPSTCAPSSNITAAIQTSSGGYICQTSTGFSLQSTSGTISSVSITPLDYTINSNTIYSFQFTPNDGIPINGAIKITAPSQVTFVNRSKRGCYYIQSGLSSNALCEVTDSKFLYITQGFKSAYTSGVVAFKINNIINPSLAVETDSFLIETYSSESFSYLIDTDQTVKISPTSAILSSVIITPSSIITGDITSYTFSIQTSSPIPQGGQVKVNLPTEISITDTTKTCSNGIGFSNWFSCVLTTSSIVIENGFQSGSFMPGQLSFVLDGIKNPVTTQPSSTFQVFTIYDNTVIDSLTSGIIITMEVPHTMSGSITPSSYKVGDTASYQFLLQPFNPLPISTSILISPPSSWNFPSTIGCTSSGNNISSISCTLQGSSLLLSLTLSSSSASQISLTVSSVINPSSTTPTNSFSLTTKSGSYLIDSISSDLALQMTTVGDLKQVTITPNDYGISIITDYSFVFITTNMVPSGGYLELLIPKSITITSSTKCKSNNYVSCTLQGTNTLLVYLFSSTFYAGQITFTIESLQNYNQAATSDPFMFTTKTSTGYSIDSYSGNPITFICYSPCEACSTYPTACTSCISDSNYPYYWNGACYETCQTGWIDLSNTKTCTKCSSNCKACSGSESNCISCTEQSPYLIEGRCSSICPTGYLITEDNQCLKCDTSCLSCSGETTNCSSCPSPKKLYSGTCIDNCEANTMVEISNECFNCNVNCEQCSLFPTNCTSCQNGQILWNNVCVSTCPTDIAVTIDRVCLSCDKSCKTCAGSTSSCTSCNDGFYLYSQQCLQNCPSGYTKIDTVCEKCSANCQECSGTVDNCIECETGKYLYDGNCVSYCPSAVTIVDGSSCIDCKSTCKTCSGSIDSCVTCPSNKYFYMNQCLSSCPVGTLPTNGECETCNSNCKTCENSSSSCTACENSKFLYRNECLEECPSHSAKINETCVDCELPCISCDISATNCTLCENSYYLYEGSCLLQCPEGNIAYKGKCVTTALKPGECAIGCGIAELGNKVCDPECNVKACDYDNGLCLASQSDSNDKANYSTNFYFEKVPFPTTIASVSSIGVATAGKILAGSFIMPSAVALGGIIESCSWAIVINSLWNTNSTHGRELLESKNESIEISFYWIIGVIIVHILLNALFLAYYFLSYCRKDDEHCKWLKSNFIVTTIVIFLSLVVSFKFIRFFYTNIPKIESSQAIFTTYATLYMPLAIFTVISFILTTLPICGVMIYNLFIFSPGNVIFSQSLDSLVVTAFIAFISFIEIALMVFEIGKEKSGVINQ
ncbi:unnamed protein product [Blepharisma stoltei]|uniref:Uncharacterized protein n=1 Tax=Blepharisma stoltei TaxID=1481888 RepID=A0AAU9K9Q6_9CILI|nr:unnamed protein product [Blepharisma stoltei]